MNSVKSVRTAAAVSLVLLGLWTFLTAVCYIFQPTLMDYIYGGNLALAGFDERVFLLSTASDILKVFLIAAAAVMLYSGRGRYSPLVISAVTLGVSPVVDRVLNFIQMKLTSIFDGVEGIAAISVFSSFTNMLGFLIVAGGIVTVAAGAVNAYAKNREPESAFPTAFK